jgi:spore maturation protein CgeB
MKIVYFAHAVASCWNNGNAHFLRGVLSELIARGHDVRVYEEPGGWSRENLIADQGEQALCRFARAYPDLALRISIGCDDAEAACEGADLVIVHEWNSPRRIGELGRLRARGARFTLLYHDTHHRAVSAPHEIDALALDAYDGVLAFCQSLADVYHRRGWGRRAFVWHEAADVRRFRPLPSTRKAGLVWIGNWGDDERTRELDEFLFSPAAGADAALDVYGVRFPARAQAHLRARGFTYRGWLANAEAPSVFANHIATAHVPRGAYVALLPGAPTIRVFEALACGIPLVSAPWPDVEQLFRIGDDFLMARDGAHMRRLLRAVLNDSDLRSSLIRSGLSRRARSSWGERRCERRRRADGGGQRNQFVGAMGACVARADRAQAAPDEG